MDIRERQRAWLRIVLARTGLSGTALAKKAHVAQTTITRVLNDPEHPYALNARNVEAIEKATGVKFSDAPSTVFLAEADAAPYRIDEAVDDLAPAVRQIVAGRNGADPWQLKGRALETAGFLAGDIVVVDMNAEPRPGDIVCAQAYKWGAMTAQTLFRVYEPPFLVAKTLDPTIPTMTPVDNHNVVIKGVVIASLRPRQARAA